MTKYTYKVVRDRVNSWSVQVIGPKGGKRWIASYSTPSIANQVANFLNRMDGK
jgi:hypothetical protein